MSIEESVDALMGRQHCEFCTIREATVYGGYQGASSWAGYACDACAEHNKRYNGFQIWEKVPQRRTDG